MTYTIINFSFKNIFYNLFYILIDWYIFIYIFNYICLTIIYKYYIFYKMGKYTKNSLSLVSYYNIFRYWVYSKILSIEFLTKGTPKESKSLTKM